LFAIAMLPIGFAFAPFLGVGFADDARIDFDNPIYLLFYVIVAVLQFIGAYGFFRIKRFKRGFHFLFEKYTVVVAMIVAGMVLTIITLIAAQLDVEKSHYFGFPLVAGVIIIGAGIVIWIRRSIKAMQRKWAKEDNAAMLQEEVDNLKQELQLERAVHENLRTANHSLNHRLVSMERSVVGFLEKHRLECSAELSTDLGIALDEIRRLSREHAADVSRVKHDIILPSTNVKVIDDLFGLFAARFASNGITFRLTVAGSIIYMTENTIEQGKLETLIGDLLQNALIAANASETSIRSVLATIGEVGDHYELSVHDSGISFEPDTLIRLGTERVTTHADDGGSGVGFMKTFETMRERKASLIIRENKGGVFSKSVTIRFDGKGQYIIETYRPGDFPPSNRYTIDII
jgi:signal transduction histidine kinase